MLGVDWAGLGEIANYNLTDAWLSGLIAGHV